MCTFYACSQKHEGIAYIQGWNYDNFFDIMKNFCCIDVQILPWEGMDSTILGREIGRMEENYQKNEFRQNKINKLVGCDSLGSLDAKSNCIQLLRSITITFKMNDYLPRHIWTILNDQNSLLIESSFVSKNVVVEKGFINMNVSYPAGMVMPREMWTWKVELTTGPWQEHCASNMKRRARPLRYQSIRNQW